MPQPQQPGIARSRAHTPINQDTDASVLDAEQQPTAKGAPGPVPADNQPGHHPDTEQDKPDLDAFAARLSGREERSQASPEQEQAEPGAGDRPQPRTAPEGGSVGGASPLHLAFKLATLPTRIAFGVGRSVLRRLPVPGR